MRRTTTQRFLDQPGGEMDGYRSSERGAVVVSGCNAILTGREAAGGVAVSLFRFFKPCPTRSRTALLSVFTLRDMSLRWFVKIAGSLGLILCSGCGQERSLQSFGGPTMGNHYSVVYAHEAGQPDGQALHHEVDVILAEVDQQMSLWRSDSELARFNDLPANSCRAMPESILTLVRVGQELSRESNGAFDVTVLPLMELWGYGPDVPDGQAEQTPSRQQLDRTLVAVGYRGLRIDGQRLCKDFALQVDLNSIAAGYAVDRIGQRLEALGVHDYQVQLAGELKTRGRKPDGSAWRVTLEIPRTDRQTVQKVFALGSSSVSTSSDHTRFYGGDRHQGSRTLDALTGMPVDQGLASVTVVHPLAVMADGLSSVLLIMGAERGWNYAQEHQIAAFFVIRADKRFIIRTNASFDRLVTEQPR